MQVREPVALDLYASLKLLILITYLNSLCFSHSYMLLLSHLIARCVATPWTAFIDCRKSIKRPERHMKQHSIQILPITSSRRTLRNWTELYPHRELKKVDIISQFVYVLIHCPVFVQVSHVKLGILLLFQIFSCHYFLLYSVSSYQPKVTISSYANQSYFRFKLLA